PRSRAVPFKATFSSASARTPARNHNHMTDFSCKTILAINQFSVYHNAAAQPCSECDKNKVLHPSCPSEKHFTQRCRLRVIGKNRLAMQRIRKIFCQWNYTFPLQVGSVFNSAFKKVSVRSSYSYAFKF